MNPRKHLKFISLVAIVSVVLIMVLLRVDVSLAIYTAILADFIQIVSYLIWLGQREVPLENIPKQVEVIYQYVQQKEESYRAKEEIVTRLVNEGVIPENELYSLIRNKEVVLAFPYGKGFPEGIKKLGYRRPPQIDLLEKIGFVRVTRLQNLMVTFTDRLPKSLGEIDNLNAFIKNELPKIWKGISEKAVEAFPPIQHQKYEKWRTGKGFGVMYILSKSMAQDFIIDYINRESFTPEFKRHIWGAIDRSELKNAIRKRKHQVKAVISKISIDILLRFPSIYKGKNSGARR